MRAPHHFLTGNLVLRTPTDAWAIYQIQGQSYPGLPDARKVEVGERLEALAFLIESDFQILRIARSFDAEAYERAATSTLDPRHGRGDEFARHLAEHRSLLEERGAIRTEIYLAVRLDGSRPGPFGGLLDDLSLLWRGVADRLGLEDGAGVSVAALGQVRAAEEAVHERVLAYLDARRIGPRRVADLIRRAYTRGLGEPDSDEAFAPQALTFLGPGGEERFRPYAHDLLRLHESRVTVGLRSLTVDSERGRGHQAHLVLGAMPEEAAVPGPAAELMFAPLELGFPVDATLSVSHLPNAEARRLLSRRKLDAEQIAREEEAGAQGISVDAADRPALAHELEGVLGGGDRPPLLRSALVLSLGAPDEREMEARVERIRESYGRVQLHRPAGEQHRLLLATMPAAPFPLPEYREHLLPDQLGAMVPHAVSQVGSRAGPYIGHVLSGSRSPVLFDLAEASQSSRPPTCLLAGSLGSGKTMLTELLIYQAFLQGSGPIVAIDPKGDYRLDALPGVAEVTETIELSGHERHRGLLDPLRVGAEDAREDLAYSFLTSILPEPVAPAWKTSLRAAISEAVAAGAHHCGEVVRRLAGSGDADASDLAAALEVHGRGGLAKLGLGTEEDAGHGPGAEVVSLRIAGLTLPRAGTPRGDLLEDERIGLAILRLLAAYALRLCAADTSRHSVLAMDEAWALLSDSQGLALLERFTRLGRSQNISPILATQIIGDAEQLKPLVGAFFAFGVETEGEAKAALDLLHLDTSDEGAVRRLIGHRAGRCHLRDFSGQVGAIQVEPPAWMLEALDTTPGR